MPSNHQPPLHLRHSFPSKMGYFRHRDVVTHANCRSKMLTWSACRSLNLLKGLLACSWVFVSRTCPALSFFVFFFFFTCENIFSRSVPRGFRMSGRWFSWTASLFPQCPPEADWSPETTPSLFPPWLFLILPSRPPPW